MAGEKKVEKGKGWWIELEREMEEEEEEKEEGQWWRVAKVLVQKTQET